METGKAGTFASKIDFSVFETFQTAQTVTIREENSTTDYISTSKHLK